MRTLTFLMVMCFAGVALAETNPNDFSTQCGCDDHCAVFGPTYVCSAASNFCEENVTGIPCDDGGVPQIDFGVPTDAGIDIPNGEGLIPDAGPPQSDGGTPQDDGGAPQSDGGSPQNDAGANGGDDMGGCNVSAAGAGAGWLAGLALLALLRRRS